MAAKAAKQSSGKFLTRSLIEAHVSGAAYRANRHRFFKADHDIRYDSLQLGRLATHNRLIIR